MRENVPRDTGSSRLLEDTAEATPLPSAEYQTFNLQIPGQRDSLHAEIKRHRERWRASGARDYDYLLRISCFCPGQEGWVLLEVRGGQVVRAWNSQGRPARLTRDNNYSIDGLFDLLEQQADHNDVVAVGFEDRWHYPVYIRTDMRLGLPDDWGIFEVRGFKPH